MSLNTITCRYDGTSIVERSIELGKPIVYVSMNYRLAGKPLIITTIYFSLDVKLTFVLGFGFLASKEVKEAGVGNLGLQDRESGLHTWNVVKI
jgi:acetylcholinesterase